MPPATGLAVLVLEATGMSHLTALGSRQHFAYFECFVVKPGEKLRPEKLKAEIRADL
jgi:hypothetical protein